MMETSWSFVAFDHLPGIAHYEKKKCFSTRSASRGLYKLESVPFKYPVAHVSARFIKFLLGAWLIFPSGFQKPYDSIIMYITSGLLAALTVQLSLATPVQRREIPADPPSKLEVVAGLQSAGVLKRALPTVSRSMYIASSYTDDSQCNHDNLFRIFLDKRYSSSASAYCSYYIESTSTVTATTAPVVPVTR